MIRRAVAVAVALGAALPSAAGANAGWLPPFDVTTVQNVCSNSPSPCNTSDARPRVAMSSRGDVAFAFTDAADDALMLRVRPPGGVLGPVETLATAASGGSIFLQGLAFDGSGNLTALYTRDKFSAPMAFSASARVRRADGTFLDEEPLATGTTASFRTDFDMNARGEAVAAWQADGPVQAAFRPAGGTFGSATTLAASGGGASGPQAAIGAGGDAVVVWTETTNHDLDASYRPAGGAFTTPGHKISTLQAPFGSASAVAPDGSVVFVWVATTGSDTQVQRALRAPGAGGAFTSELKVAGPFTGGFTFVPGVTTDNAGTSVAAFEHNGVVEAAFRSAGGEFGAPSPLGSGGSSAFGADPSGGVAVTWLNFTSDPPVLQAAVRPAGGGAFGSATTVKTGTSGHFLENAGAGMDAEGNGVTGFSDFSSSHAGPEPVAGAGFDAVPPRLSGLQVAAGGGQHTPLPFSVGTFDEWGPVTTTWSFGDGATAEGASLQHSFDKPGGYDVSVTAHDAVGNSAGPLTGHTAIADTEAPSFANASLSNRTFRDAAAATVVAARRKRVPRGTTIRFALSEAAAVAIRVQHRVRGRKVGRRCVRQTRRNRTRKRCSHFVRATATLRRAGQAGPNSVRFTGRVRKKKLRPGVYRFVLQATDAARHKSTASRLRFRVVR